jgi:hypothetical protein
MLLSQTSDPDNVFSISATLLRLSLHHRPGVDVNFPTPFDKGAAHVRCFNFHDRRYRGRHWRVVARYASSLAGRAIPAFEVGVSGWARWQRRLLLKLSLEFWNFTQSGFVGCAEVLVDWVELLNLFFQSLDGLVFALSESLLRFSILSAASLRNRQEPDIAVTRWIEKEC